MKRLLSSLPLMLGLLLAACSHQGEPVKINRFEQLLFETPANQLHDALLHDSVFRSTPLLNCQPDDPDYMAYLRTFVSDPDMRTEGVQRRAAFLNHFATCDFSTVQTTADLHLDTLCSSTHGVSHSHLDSTTVSNLTFYLASDVVGNDVCIELRLLHFIDINLNLLVVEFFQLFLELVYILTTLADNQTRTSCADGNGDQLQRALDDNLGDTGLGQTLIQILTDFLVFHQVITEVLASEPIGIPTLDNAKAVANRIYFLSHTFLFICSFSIDK